MKICQLMFVLRSLMRLLTSLSACIWLCAQLHAQTAAPVASPAPTPTTDVPSVGSAAKSPVDLFRELLVMDSSEREEWLARRDPAERKAILAKLQEYDSLTPEERELRLRTTQLHWYMLKFLKIPVTNWTAQLTAIPKADRALVEARITQWRILPPQLQAEILEYESTSSYFYLGGGSVTNSQKILQNLPSAKRRELEEKLANWNALSTDEQRRMQGQFEHFFGLTASEKEKTLTSLSEPERVQMEKTLQSYQQLPRATRELCLQSFGKFARMTTYRQQQFLKNAERWREMSPSERDAWQRLVPYLAQTPPMPPGMDPLPDKFRTDPRLATPPSPNNSLLTPNTAR